jgi:hypothetical protein
VAISGTNLFVTNVQGPNPSTVTASVGEYATSGDVINASLVAHPNEAFGVAVLGNYLFASNFGGGSISEYDATTGALLDGSFLSNLKQPVDLTTFGSDLFVVNYGGGQGEFSDGSVGEYTLDPSDGTVTSSNPDLITGLDGPFGVAVVAVPEASTTTLLLFCLGLALGRFRSRRV